MNGQIRDEIGFWVERVSALLGACEVLVEYYGTDEEDELLRASVAPLRQLVEMLAETGEKNPDLRQRLPASVFMCGEELAGILTPLLRIVVEWEPHFTTTAREELDEHEARRIIVPYGLFLGEANRCICHPLWTAYPQLAPEGWSG